MIARHKPFHSARCEGPRPAVFIDLSICHMTLGELVRPSWKKRLVNASSSSLAPSANHCRQPTLHVRSRTQETRHRHELIKSRDKGVPRLCDRCTFHHCLILTGRGSADRYFGRYPKKHQTACPPPTGGNDSDIRGRDRRQGAMAGEVTAALCRLMAATTLVSSGRKPVKSIVLAFGRTTLCANTFFPYPCPYQWNWQG